MAALDDIAIALLVRGIAEFAVSLVSSGASRQCQILRIVLVVGPEGIHRAGNKNPLLKPLSVSLDEVTSGGTTFGSISLVFVCYE